MNASEKRDTEKGPNERACKRVMLSRGCPSDARGRRASRRSLRAGTGAGVGAGTIV